MLQLTIRVVWSSCVCATGRCSIVSRTSDRWLCSRSPVANHFLMFQLEERFDIDVKQLSKRFKQMQTSHHPDKFVDKSQLEQNTASDRSSDINHAYDVLKDPLARSLHLLEIAGHPLHEQTSDVDADFLAEVLEINEQLAEVSNVEQLNEIKRLNNGILENLYKELTRSFDRGDYVEARQIVAKIKYYANVDAKVRNYEHEHNIL